jgi:ABC-type multidrug transport system permease subunit
MVSSREQYGGRKKGARMLFSQFEYVAYISPLSLINATNFFLTYTTRTIEKTKLF